MRRLVAIAGMTLLGWLAVLVAALSSERLAALPVAVAMGALAGRVEEGARASAWRQASAWAAWLLAGTGLGAATIPRWAADGAPLALVGCVALSSLGGALVAAPLDAHKEMRWARVAARTAGLMVSAAGYRAGNAYLGLALGALTYAALLASLSRAR
jgi:hypothetical protein